MLSDQIQALATSLSAAWFLLIIVHLIFGTLDARMPRRRAVAGLAFATAALVIAQHFNFSIAHQCLLVFAVYVGVISALPGPTKPETGQ
jgi:hypothetical protein